MPDLGIQQIVPATYIPKGYQQITDASAVTSLTVPSNANVAIIQVLGDAVRYRDDGTNPSTTVGMQIAAGQILPYHGDLSALRLIEEGTDAEINILYYDTSALDN